MGERAARCSPGIGVLLMGAENLPARSLPRSGACVILRASYAIGVAEPGHGARPQGNGAKLIRRQLTRRRLTRRLLIGGSAYQVKAVEDDVELCRAVQVLQDRVVECVRHCLRHGI